MFCYTSEWCLLNQASRAIHDYSILRSKFFSVFLTEKKAINKHILYYAKYHPQIYKPNYYNWINFMPIDVLNLALFFSDYKSNIYS